MYVQPHANHCTGNMTDIVSPAAFKSFLTDFKASPADSLTHALGGMDIAEDDLDDEYDFMDDDNDEEELHRQERADRKKPYHKYKEIMQQLANRKIDEVLVDLDDVSQVHKGALGVMKPDRC